MPTPAQEALTKYFGHDAFRGGQEEVIQSLLDGHSSLAIFPTGGGKSICYQLPALLLDGLTLVVSPLIALMKDQVDAMQARGIAAARLDSSLTADETKNLYHDLQAGKLKLLYIAPERFSNERFRDTIKNIKVALLAIDEAHCISEWGHNFRPDYLKLAHLSKTLNIPRVLGLTATATPAVSEDICQHFQIAPEHHHQLTFHRKNLHLSVSPANRKQRDQLLLEKVKLDAQGNVQPTIIYVTLQATAENVAAKLQAANIPARPYHAGLRPETRNEIQEQFMAGTTPVICATIAFGMGIDKSNIRHIVHYNLPKSLENYTQEIGRAGRDGADASCDLLANADDLLTLQNFIYADTPSPTAVQMILHHILDQPAEFDISLYKLSAAHDIKNHVLATLLTYMETDGYLVTTKAFYAAYAVKFSRNLDHMLNGFSAERQTFLKTLFESGKQGPVWTEINPEESATALGIPVTKITDTLQYLEDHGDIILKPSQIRQGYRILNKPDNIPELVKKLNALFQKRETSDLDRLQEVVDYAETGDCHYVHLLDHFGEEIPPCGHCANCQEKKKNGTALTATAEEKALPTSAIPEVDPETLERIQTLVKERHPALRSPRQLARFLCGLSSPATQYVWYLPAGMKRKKRLTHHDAYAILENHPFPDALALCEAQVI